MNEAEIEKLKKDGGIFDDDMTKGYSPHDLLYMKIYTQIFCALIVAEPNTDRQRLSQEALNYACAILDQIGFSFELEKTPEFPTSETN